MVIKYPNWSATRPRSGSSGELGTLSIHTFRKRSDVAICNAVCIYFSHTLLDKENSRITSWHTSSDHSVLDHCITVVTARLHQKTCTCSSIMTGSWEHSTGQIQDHVTTLDPGGLVLHVPFM